MSSHLQLVRLALGFAAAVVMTMPAPMASSARGVVQSTPAVRTTADTRHLTMTTSSTPAGTAKAGQRIVLNVDVALKPRMHVYAPDQPKGQDYLPIVLTITAGDGFRLEKPHYPSSEKFFFAPLKETQHVYSKPFRIAQAIVVTREGVSEPLEITGTVRYQACDDALCYVPQTVPVKWILPASGVSRQEH
jgi:DsbC/DsbD-like thiol-disulfide interchange protein